jgi:molybdopterin molybdotransferase
MITFDEALALIRDAARPLGSETLGVGDATNRVLAASVISQIASPRCDVSAMDGYAVREADLASFPVKLELAGESFAGSGWGGTIEAGQCVRIFTGAPVPSGADRVVIQEDVTRDGNAAIISDDPGQARHIRRRGSDFERGEELLPAGRLLDKRAIVAAAAADLSTIEVFSRPRVTILGTGDELAEPGSASDRPDAIPESVSLGVAALAAEWGGEVIGRQRLRDDLPTMEAAAAEAIVRSDVAIVTGGASVGERDFAKSMFHPLGLDLIFSKVSIKPGKPVWLGRVGGTFVVGLPGNPTSALVTGRLFLAPLLAGLTGRSPNVALEWSSARLANPLKECGARETFHRARLAGGEAQILAFQDSSAQRALAHADVLVRQRAGSPALAAGVAVEILDF